MTPLKHFFRCFFCIRSARLRLRLALLLPLSNGLWWAHLDSNQDRTGYEPGALPIELWARRPSYHRGRVSRFQEAPELLGARGMPQLAERLGLDLPDPLAGDREVLADFLQRVLAPVGEPEAQAQHLLLSRR